MGSFKPKNLNTPIKYNKKNFSLWVRIDQMIQRVGCKAPSSLVELIDCKLILEKKLNEFESSFDLSEKKKRALTPSFFPCNELC